MNLDAIEIDSKITKRLLHEVGPINDANMSDPLTFVSLLVAYQLHEKALAAIKELIESLRSMQDRMAAESIINQVLKIIDLATPVPTPCAPVPSESVSVPV